jgi:hypothetical protein
MEALAVAIGKYSGDLKVAWRRANVLRFAIAAVWLVFPTAAATLLHPFDLIALQAWLADQPIPRFVTSGALMAATVEALVILLALGLLQLGQMVVFYRRAQFSVALWPLPFLLVGMIGGGAWWLWFGQFRLEGALIGLTPVVLTVVCQAAVERMSQDFVFGKSNRPQRQPWELA